MRSKGGPLAIRRSALLVLAVLASKAGLAHAAAASAPGHPDILADSTVVERWTLSNGLRVTTRHIPDAGAVAATVGYPFGSDQDPPGRLGLAQLLGLLAFTSAAGTFPERSADDIESQRPLGWSYPVTRRQTLFTEIATIGQFPGMLSQIAARMRGVTVTPQELKEAIGEVRREIADQAFGPPAASLDYLVREVALGHDEPTIGERASGRDVESITLREVEDRLKERFVPANATLSLAGNLRTVDIHRLVENLFGGIPAGVAAPATPLPHLDPGVRIIPRPGLTASVASVGILAPALDDTLHPSFLLASLMIGSQVDAAWSTPSSPESRFHFAFLDEPDLARISVPVPSRETDVDTIAVQLDEVLGDLARTPIAAPLYFQLQTSDLWLIGGPMRREVRDASLTEAGVLHTLARGMASCALLRDEAFWAAYRQRLVRTPMESLGRWLPYFNHADHQVRVLLVPAASPDARPTRRGR